MKQGYIPLQKVQILQKTLGWLEDYTPEPNEIHYIGENLKDIDLEMSNLLKELGEINLRRQEIINIFMTESTMKEKQTVYITQKEDSIFKITESGIGQENCYPQEGYFIKIDEVPFGHSILVPTKYEKDKTNIEVGKYLVVRKDGKTHFENWNGAGWAYNDNSINVYYLPKIST